MLFFMCLEVSEVLWGFLAGFADANIIAVVAPQPAISTLPHSLAKYTCRLPLPLRLFISLSLFQPFLQFLLVLLQLLHGLLVLLLQGSSLLLLDLGGGLIGGFLIAFFIVLLSSRTRSSRRKIWFLECSCFLNLDTRLFGYEG